MNKMRSCRITSLILAALAFFLLVAGICGMAQPISYGSHYYHASFYEEEDFTGTMTFYPDNTMVVSNTNFDEEIKFFYYYKDGYIFFPVGETQEDYEKEVAAINEDFEGAVNAPFYASKINSFRLYSEGPDGYRSVYLCQMSIMMLVPLIAIELLLIGFAVRSAKRCKKEMYENA